MGRAESRIPSLYPHGFADVVGYWAETHIFGGVVVFDRGADDGMRHVSTCTCKHILTPVQTYRRIVTFLVHVHENESVLFENKFITLDYEIMNISTY